MTYVIIARKSELVGGRVKKYAPLLPKNAVEYIKAAQNPEVHEDRLAGYTLLFLTYSMLLERGVFIPTDNGEKNIKEVGVDKNTKKVGVDKNIKEGDGKKNIKEDNSTLKMRHILRLTPEIAEKYSLAYGELEVSRTPAGKPYINGICLYFNLSHSGDIVALAISTDRDVGVDVQLKIDPTRAERLSSRFFTTPIATDTLGDVEYLYASADDSGIVFQNITRDNAESAYPAAGRSVSIAAVAPDSTVDALVLSDGDEYTVRWSIGEAILKCDGRGFEAIGELDCLAEGIATSSVILRIRDKEYALTVAGRTTGF